MIFQSNTNMKSEKEHKHLNSKTEQSLKVDPIIPKNEFYKEKDLEHPWSTIFRM